MFITALLCGRLTRPHPAVTRTLQCAADTNCRRNPFIAAGNTKSKSLSCVEGQPRLAQFSRILQRGQTGSSQASSTEPCTTWDLSPLLTFCLATTTSAAFGLTQQYPTMTLTFSLASCTYESV